MNNTSVWLNIVGLMLLILAILASCQMYRDCVADGRPRYECAHYARVGR